MSYETNSLSEDLLPVSEMPRKVRISELPDNRFRVYEVPFSGMKESWKVVAEAEYARVSSAPGWNPKLVHLEGDWYIVDLCAPAGGDVSGYPHTVSLIEYKDHPALSIFEKGTPRVVLALYRKEVRLKHLRVSDFSVLEDDWSRAESAWSLYRESISKQRRQKEG